MWAFICYWIPIFSMLYGLLPRPFLFGLACYFCHFSLVDTNPGETTMVHVAYDLFSPSPMGTHGSTTHDVHHVFEVLVLWFDLSCFDFV